MMANKEQLLKEYGDKDKEHFGIPCFIQGNESLSKMLSGEGLKVAAKTFPEYIYFHADLLEEDKYKVFKLAKTLNDNPDIVFFSVVADSDMKGVHINFWGTEELINAAHFFEDSPNTMLGFITKTNRE